MVKNGENICYLYASVLPRLFTSSKTHRTMMFNINKLKRFFGEEPPPSPGSLSWHTDTKPLAHQLLNLSILTLTHNMSTPFQLCAIVVPKLVRNIDSVKCSDEQKMSLLLDMLKITQKTLEAGHSIEELITHGLDLLSNLLPPEITADQLRNLINEIVHQLVAPGNSTMLFMIKSACRYMKDSFPDEVEQVQALFRALLHKGRKNEIRSVFKLCRDPFNSSLYTSVRGHLYLFANGSINARQLLALCELIMSSMSLQRVTRQQSSSSQLSEEEIEERARVREREEVVLVKLITPCLAEVDSAVREGRFKREVWTSSQQQLARIALFRTLILWCCCRHVLLEWITCRVHVMIL